jgi:FMN-dependent NADH-azoreductase
LHTLSLALSESLIAELQAADAVLISTPMHNFMLPSVLKAWVDHVLRPGRSFARTPQGKQGLLADRPVAMLMACGGAVSNGQQQDWASPYMAYACQTMGLHSFQSIILENCNRDTAARAASLAILQRWQQGWPW